MTSPRALFIVPELAPLTGDSARAKEHHFLSRAIAEFGVDVTVAVPGHRVAESEAHGLARRLTPLTVADPDGAEVDVTVFEGSASGGRVSVLVLGEPDAQPHSDAMFVRAVLDILEERHATPDVVFASHGSESCLTHLTGSDGQEPIKVFLLREQTPDKQLTEALANADRIVVASSDWATRLLQRIAQGHRDLTSKRLAPLKQRIRGIASGIDVVEWNPHQDGLLDKDFPRDPRAGKAAHKARLRRAVHLSTSKQDTPLVAVLGPFDGNILSYGALNELSQLPIQLVVVADPAEDAGSLSHLTRLANQIPTRLAIRTFADPGERRAFTHDLLAAADFSLFAREFSPGGLGELYCMRYGAIPIAPRVGSYKDILVEFDSLTCTGSGFLFNLYEREHLIDAMQRAINAYGDQQSFGQLIERAMTLDLSWRSAAQRYVNLLVDVIRERRASAELAS